MSKKYILEGIFKTRLTESEVKELLCDDFEMFERIDI